MTPQLALLTILARVVIRMVRNPMQCQELQELENALAAVERGEAATHVYQGDD